MEFIKNKKWLSPIYVVGCFLIISIIYSWPAIEGKELISQDSIQTKANQREMQVFKAETGATPKWTNGLFSGMPLFQIASKNPYNIANFPKDMLRHGLPVPVNFILLYLGGIYILMLTYGFSHLQSAIGAIAFAFSSYNFIILAEMHTSKALAIGLMPPVLGGIVLAYRKHLFGGAVLTAFFTALQIKTGHYQITYYLLLIIAAYLITLLIRAIREKQVTSFIKKSVIVFLAAILGVLPNTAKLWSAYTYGQQSIRGGASELSNKGANLKAGLDKDYATRWSYGPMETFTLLIPNLYGGTTTAKLNEQSTTYKTLIQQGVPSQQAKQFISRGVPLYWGPQPFTAGPVYAGAVVCFLFVLGLFLIRGPTRWWILGISLVAIMVSWGRHFQAFFDLFFHYFPLFNKFRTPSMILVILSVTFPLLGMLGLRKFLLRQPDKKTLLKHLKVAFVCTGGLCAFFALFGGTMMSFSGDGDARLQQMAGPWLVDAVKADRKAWLQYDAFRSLLFIAGAAGVLWFYLKDKLKLNHALLLLGGLILVDMWGVNKRYLNNDNFKLPTAYQQSLSPNQADQMILKHTGHRDFESMLRETHFRVFNLATDNPFTDARNSYFHKSIGGYHAAKMRRYQELIEWHLSNYFGKGRQLAQEKGADAATRFLERVPLLGALNTKYFILPGQERGKPVARINRNAAGNAWFVSEHRIAQNADEEMEMLRDFNPRQTAIIHQREAGYINGLNHTPAPSDTIYLTSYHPDRMTYRAHASNELLAVFSEIYYNDKEGWQVHINGEPARHIRVNYVTRALRVPPGEHTIVFEFRPRSFYTGEKIALTGSILLLLCIGIALFKPELGKKLVGEAPPTR